MIDQSRIENFFKRFPLLLGTIEKLNAAGIQWMIGGSSCLYLLGNERLPDDVDIFFRNPDHDGVDKLFGISSYTHDAKEGPVRNSNPNNDHSIQFTSSLIIEVDGSKYDLAVTDAIIGSRISGHYLNQTFWLMPPEEVLLLKAILRRGKDVGKKDLEDIQNFLRIYKELDIEYLERRIDGLQAKIRVGSTFANIKIVA